MPSNTRFQPRRAFTLRCLVLKLQGLRGGVSLRLERVFRLTGQERLDRLPQVFGWKHPSRSLWRVTSSHEVSTERQQPAIHL